MGLPCRAARWRSVGGAKIRKNLVLGWPLDNTATLRPWRGQSQVGAAFRASLLAIVIMRNPVIGKSLL